MSCLRCDVRCREQRFLTRPGGLKVSPSALEKKAMADFRDHLPSCSVRGAIGLHSCCMHVALSVCAPLPLTHLPPSPLPRRTRACLQQRVATVSEAAMTPRRRACTRAGATPAATLARATRASPPHTVPIALAPRAAARAVTSTRRRIAPRGWYRAQRKARSARRTRHGRAA